MNTTHNYYGTTMVNTGQLAFRKARSSWSNRIWMAVVTGLLFLLPSTALHAQFTYTTNNGAITIAGFSCNGSSMVTIPSRIGGLTVTRIGDNAFSGGCGYPFSVTIPTSVISIGDGAFSDCYGLTNITIPTSVISIGSRAFADDALDNITIPTSVTSIGSNAFANCDLSSVTIPASVTSIENGTFAGCSGLTNVTIGGSVTNIGNYAFYSCYNLSDITIPNSVTSIGRAAFYLGGLTDITIPASVTHIGDFAFGRSEWLNEISVDTNNPAYSSVDGVLFDKRQTTLIQFPEIGGPPDLIYTIPPTVTNIVDEAFAWGSLDSITIPASVTRIGDSAFVYCYNLTSVTISNSVTSIGDNAFDSSHSLTNIALGTSVTSIGNSAFYRCDNLTSITLPASVTNIGDSAFAGCSGLTNVTIGSSVANIGDSAFEDCSLTVITIPASVTNIGSGAFGLLQGNTELISVYFLGNAPGDGSDWSVFLSNWSGIAYYLPGTTGWGEMFDGLPTVLWTGKPYVRVDVWANPDNGGTASGGGLFAVGTNVQLVASANTNWIFTGWSDDDSSNPRTITVPDTNITYTANFDACTYTLSPSNANVSANAGGGSFNVTTGPGCGWTWIALSGQSWLHTTSSGIGNGTIHYAVEANRLLSSRTGTVSVAGMSFTVVQAATPDSIGDGIPDWWRALHFVGNGTTTNSLSCATCDPDGDGVNNLQEYLSGSDPHDRMSPPARTYAWVNFVGQLGGPGNADGTNSTARFNSPSGVAVDSVGNVYVADGGNSTIRKVTPAGVVTTLAGSAGNSGSIDGTNSTARFYNPSGVAVDSAGNVYVADSYNHTIRKVTSAGVVTTLAGSAGNAGSTDGTNSTARFNYPYGVTVDAAGNVYVADYGNHTIRKVTPTGVVTTLAGSAGNHGSADGTNSTARFYYPTDVAVDAAGSVFVGDDGNFTIRKVTPAGVVTTLAGSGIQGSTDGTNSMARFNYPYGVAVDAAGNVYVSDSGNYTIRKVTTVGVVTTLAGSALTLGSADGTNSTARFYNPYGVAVDSAGNVYVADSGNHTIRKVTSAGVVTTLAGSAGHAGKANGTGIAAQLNNPSGVVVDSSGNVYVADKGNLTIRKVTSVGVVTTLAGSAGHVGTVNGTGIAAQFNNPSGVAVDSTGNVYVADSGNHTIRKVTSAGVVTTLAGSAGNPGGDDGTNSTSRFTHPSGVAVDGAGNVFVADTYNDTIRKVTPVGTNWVVTTLAGITGFRGGADGTNSTARFGNPSGVVVDSAGNVYVADSGNHTIRKVTPMGVVTTLAGSAGFYGSANGTNNTAQFNYPSGVAVDSAGNVYVADTNNDTIRKVTPVGTNWVVTTIGGIAGVIGGADGFDSDARFSGPTGIAVDSMGILYVADSGNNRLTKGTPTTLAMPALTIATGSPLPSGMVGTLYTQTLQTTNGIAPYSWFVVSNSLPAGLVLVPDTGAITGTPTVVTTANFKVQVTDSTSPTNQVATQNFTLTISPGADSVGDGIPNWWRALYFGGNGTTTNSRSCATCDPNGNGTNNLHEYLAGANPTNVIPIVQASVTQAVFPAGTPVPIHVQSVAPVTTQSGAGYSLAVAHAASALTGTPIPNVAVTVYLTTAGTVRTLTAVTDAAGQATVTFVPLAGEAGHYAIAAALTSAPVPAVQATFALVGADPNVTQLTQRLYLGYPATNTLALVNRTDVALTGIHAVLVGGPGFVSFQATTPGTLTGGGTNILTGVFLATGQTGGQSNCLLRITSAEGITNDLPVHLDVAPPVPQLVVSPTPLLASMVRSNQTLVTCVVSNAGGAASGVVQVQLPNSPPAWLGLVTPALMPPLAPEASAPITFSLAPAAALPLGPYTGNFGVVDPVSGATSVPFQFTCVSALRGSLQVTVVDEFTYYAVGAPKVTNATVTVIDPYALTNLASAVTDTNGVAVFTGLPEGYYRVAVQAPHHGSAEMMALVTGSQTNLMKVFLSRQMVTYRWIVTPTARRPKRQPARTASSSSARPRMALGMSMRARSLPPASGAPWRPTSRA